MVVSYILQSNIAYSEETQPWFNLPKTNVLITFYLKDSGENHFKATLSMINNNTIFCNNKIHT